jgi:acid-sensing ion channel, other
LFIHRYIFDYFSSKNWSSEKGYLTHDLDTYPVRPFMSGKGGALSFDITSSISRDIDYFCSEGDEGFKLIFHEPATIPNVKRQYMQIPFGQKSVINIKPGMIKTSRELRRVHPSRRYCYFEDEKFLRFFKVYSQSNCEIECRTNFTLKSCGCVKYFMPRDNQTEICNITRWRCVEKSAKLYAKHMEKVWLYEYNEINNSLQNCNCLPFCTSITYDAELSTAKNKYNDLSKLIEEKFTKLEGKKNISADDYYDSGEVLALLEDRVVSKFEILFKEDHFVSARRSELYGWRDFMSNCGGIAGT